MDSIDWLDTQGTTEAHAARDELTALRAAFKAACEGQVAVAYGVLEGRDTTSCGWDYIASFAEACHDHINEAISTYDIIEAGQWKVVPLYEHPNPEAANLRMRVEALEAKLATRDQQVAEACAKAAEAETKVARECLAGFGDNAAAHCQVAFVIRSGEWKKHMKGNSND